MIFCFGKKCEMEILEIGEKRYLANLNIHTLMNSGLHSDLRLIYEKLAAAKEVSKQT